MSLIKKLILAVPLSMMALAASAEPEYVTLEMEIDINASAEDVWAKAGGFCAITDWFGIDCEYTSGDGGIGTVRVLAGGRITEVLVAQTALSYGYTMPPVEGEFYNLYHGFMETIPVTGTTSRMVYTLLFDVSNLEDQAAKDQAVEGRRATFTQALNNIKELAESN